MVFSSKKNKVFLPFVRHNDVGKEQERRKILLGRRWWREGNNEVIEGLIVLKGEE
jgi:hypothetical protein